MVGKKSGKALLREEGLERTDNNMDLTSWPMIIPINQKNYYTDYLKRDEQILAVRSQQEEARNKMIKQAKDRDRALAQGKTVGPDGDIEMDEGDEENEDEASSGAKTIVIHIGSQNLRVGLANDALPKTVPMVVARRAEMSESELNNGEPAPKRAKLSNGLPPHEPEKRFGEEFAKKFTGMSNDLKVRMRMNKRKVLPQSRDMVTSYNRRNTYESITDFNDTMRIEWTDTSQKQQCITGKAALRIPELSEPRYKLFWPIRNGWINEQDYESKRFVYEDIRIIIEDAINKQLELNIRTREEWGQYSCVIVIPDYYERTYVTSLLDMAITEFGFARVCFIQESLAASFGAGFTVACIVDIGAQKTSISCVEDGMVIDNSRVNLKYGGADITDAFVKMIIHNHFPYAEINLNRRYDFQLAEELKQKFCTMTEADVSVQLYDFHLRAPDQETRKYTFKIYDEVILAPMGLFKPQILDNTGKLNGRRKLVDKSYDIYDNKPNDPSSSAQAEILTAIAPEEVLTSTTRPATKANGITNGVTNGAKEESFNDSRRPSFSNIKEMDATPQPSAASSPARQIDGTPQPDDNDGGAPGNEKPKIEEEQEEPLSIERRDDVLPIYPLPNAIVTSINHAARGSASKTGDLLGGIMLTGGTSIIPGLAQHLEDSLRGILPGYSKDILVGRPPRELDPQVVAWKGGAVFGRMSRTNDSWINAFLYERLGERVLAHKLMWACTQFQFYRVDPAEIPDQCLDDANPFPKLRPLRTCARIPCNVRVCPTSTAASKGSPFVRAANRQSHVDSHPCITTQRYGSTHGGTKSAHLHDTLQSRRTQASQPKDARRRVTNQEDLERAIIGVDIPWSTHYSILKSPIHKTLTLCAHYPEVRIAFSTSCFKSEKNRLWRWAHRIKAQAPGFEDVEVYCEANTQSSAYVQAIEKFSTEAPSKMFSYTRTSAANHPLIPLPDDPPRQPIMLGEFIHGSVTRTVLDLLEHDLPSLGVPQVLLSRHTASPSITDTLEDSPRPLLGLTLRAGDINETLTITEDNPTIDELKTTFESFAERLRDVAHMDELKRMRPKLHPNLTDRFQGQFVEIRETLEHLEVRGPGGIPSHTTFFSAQVFHDGDALAGAYLWLDPVTARYSALEAALRALERKGTTSTTPVKIGIPASNVYLSIKAMTESRSAGLPSEYIPLSPCDQPLAKGRAIKGSRVSSRGESLPKLLKRDLTRVETSRHQSLQLYHMGETVMERIVNAIFHSDAVIILSPVGSGKTTQVPQMILDNALMSGSGMGINIICSHPNHSLVEPLASQVASERSGKQSGSIGYDLYEETKLPRGWGSITYCATATLLKRFLEDPEYFLSSFSHVIIDDVHEPQKDTELVLTLLRKSIRARKSAGMDFPKLVLLGAASEASRLVKYLRDRGRSKYALEVKELKLGGPIFDVQHHYLHDVLLELSRIPSYAPTSMLLNEKYEHRIQNYIQEEMDFAGLQAGELKSHRFNPPIFRHLPDHGVVGLVALTIAHLVATKPPGDILAFLPLSSTVDEAAILLRQMKPANVDFEDSSRFRIVKVYSQSQDSMSEPVPSGCVRVILTATAIAPSVKLPNITYVVDSGKVETRFVDNTILKAHTDRADLATNIGYTGLVRGLSTTWISQASVRERSALAGFVGGGHYYALYTPQRQKIFPQVDTPATHTSDLVQESLMLSAAPEPYDPKHIFCEMLDPPRAEIVEDAMRKLLCLDAITHNHKITSLGRVLATFFLHPAVAKALLLGALFGCLEPILVLASLNPSNVLLEQSDLLGNQHLKLMRSLLPNDSSDPASEIECFRRYHTYYVRKDYEMLQRVQQEWGIEHSTFLKIQERSHHIFMTLRRLGVVPVWTTWTKDESVFDIIPHHVNFNRKNLALVRGICLNTIHPNIAMWDTSRNGTQCEWVDTSSHLNEVDPLSIVHRTARFVDNSHRPPPDIIADPNIVPSPQLVSMFDFSSALATPRSELISADRMSLTRQRGKMLSYHGKRIIRPVQRSRLLAHLEQVSMLTPLLAILFHPTATLDPKGYIALDGRLHIDLNIEWTMEDGMGFHANQILMEFRHTIERFYRHIFSQLNMSALGGGQEGGKSQPRNQGLLLMAPLFEGKMRRAVVDSVVKVLSDDEVYRRRPRRDHGHEYKLAFENMMATVAASNANDGVITGRDAGSVATDSDIAETMKADPESVTSRVHQLTLEAEEIEE